MWVLGTLALLAAAAVVVLLTMTEVREPEPAPVTEGLPPLSPDDLRRVHVPGAGRGYDRAVVDALLERAAQTLERATAQPPVEAAATEAVTDAASGEELEDRGRDGTGGLDG